VAAAYSKIPSFTKSAEEPVGFLGVESFLGQGRILAWYNQCRRHQGIGNRVISAKKPRKWKGKIDRKRVFHLSG